MRALIQRVREAHVTVDREVVGRIGKGLLVFLGVRKGDELHQIDWLAQKVINLRIFEDERGKMNQSVKEVGGEILVVSQFTLYANCRVGRHPDFLEAAPGEIAESFYRAFVEALGKEIGVQTGKFAAKMEVALVNDGPATFVIEG